MSGGNKQGRRCWVSGRVQGVYFRGATQRKATELGLTGYARNLPDGRVEVLVCGEAAKIQALCEWLWEGPPLAEVECQVVPWEAGNLFDIH